MRLVEGKLLPDDELSLEKFETLNALSLIANSKDYVIPRELESGLKEFIQICIDYKLDNQNSTHFINQLLTANDTTTERSVTLSSITGLKQHVVNTFIRQQLICKMNELAYEHDRTGDSFDKKLYLQ